MKGFVLPGIILSIGFSIIGCTNTDKKNASASMVTLPADVYNDKVYASWLGQIIGNIYGLPHENNYVHQPRPDSLAEIEYRGWALQQMLKANGAFSDDDTDIEYMYLLQMAKHGIEPSYAQLKKAWTYHIRDRIWLANRAALTSMRYGFDPPITGSKMYNPHWFQIDPQLVNEIWAVTAPGMVDYACEKSAWAARITNDDWGIEPTVHYAAMYAAAFFEKDINTLIDIGVKALPANSRFAQTIREVRAIHQRYPAVADWRLARAELYQKFYEEEPQATRTIWNANLNGACGILALLYGNGDFMGTLDMACALGFDADNQAATMGGLLGIVHGTAGLPAHMLIPHDSLEWKKPFNDSYKNISRYDLPDTTISGMAKLTAAQGEMVIMAQGGEIREEDGQKVYLINKNATFVPQLEIAAVPDVLYVVGQPVEVTIPATLPHEELEWKSDGSNLPEGVIFSQGRLTGTPMLPGDYELRIAATALEQTTSARIPFTVFEKNLAMDANGIVASIHEADVGRRDKMWITVGRNLLSDKVDIINDGRWTGDRSVFYSVTSQASPHDDFYGYRWDQDQTIGHLAFRSGPVEENGSWFESLDVEYLNPGGEWTSVDDLVISPPLDTTDQVLNKAHYVNYHLQFKPVTTKGIRIIGPAGGKPHHRPNSSDIYYTSITELAAYPPL